MAPSLKGKVAPVLVDENGTAGEVKRAHRGRFPFKASRRSMLKALT